MWVLKVVDISSLKHPSFQLAIQLQMSYDKVHENGL